MRNPHNAAADALVARRLDAVLQEITTLDPENPYRWIIRLQLKPGFESHPLHEASFEVITANRWNPEVNIIGSSAAPHAAEAFCTEVLAALRNR